MCVCRPFLKPPSNPAPQDAYESAKQRAATATNLCLPIICKPPSNPAPQDAYESAKQRASEATEGAKSKAGELGGSAERAVRDAAGGAEGAAREAQDAAREGLAGAEGAVKEAAAGAEGKAREVGQAMEVRHGFAKAGGLFRGASGGLCRAACSRAGGGGDLAATGSLNDLLVILSASNSASQGCACLPCCSPLAPR